MSLHRLPGLLAVTSILLAGAPSARAATSLKEYGDTRKGVESYESEDFAGATQYFGRAQASNPDALVHRLNLGDALLKAGSPEAAITEFEAVTKSGDTNMAARGYYNLGKSYEAQENLEKAIQSYQSGLGRLFDDPEKSDLEVEQRIKRALEVAQQKKQQQQQGQQGKNQEQGGGSNDQQQKPQDQDKDKESKKYQIPKQKQKFKAEKLNENDAKRILKQLQEQEKKTQQRIMRSKTGKPKNDKPGKDW